MSSPRNLRPHARSALASCLVVLALVQGCSTARSGDDFALPDPAPKPAVEAVLRQLEDHRLVAIGETHGSTQMAAFLEQLVANPRFQERVGTLVLEIGSTAQRTIDDYVNGGRTTERELLAALRDSIFSESGAADPGAIALFTAVRRVNAGRPAGTRLRIVAADAPLSWAEVDSQDDLAALDRESAMAEVIEQQVLDAERRAVWVVGAGHLSPPERMAPGGPASVEPAPEGVQSPLDDAPPVSALERIEAAYPGAVYIATMYTGFGPRTPELEKKLGDVAPPAMFDLAGTWLGEDPAIALGSPHDRGDVMVDDETDETGETGDSGETVSPGSKSRSLASGQDGLLWLGDCDSLSPQLPDAAVFEDRAYRAELDRRVAISGRADRFDVDGHLSYLTELYGPC